MPSPTMWKLLALLLLLLHCRIRLAGCQQLVDLSNRPSIGSIDFKGSNLRVFEVDGVQFAEPNIQFDQTCGDIKFNHLYLKYQLSVPVLIEVNTLQKPLGDGKRLGQLTVSRLEARADEALSNVDSKLGVLTQLRKLSEGRLIFLCDDFERCRQLRIEMASNPQRLQRAIQFTTVGSVSGLPVRFGSVESSNPPPVADCITGKWVVFQRRVDGSLSFAQNWDSYVRGFGNPHSNYWMGLNRLFDHTVTSVSNGFGESARCQLRVETTDHANNRYWGEYKDFQVLSPGQFYRLKVANQVAGTTIEQIGYHNEGEFTTYDQRHDRCSGESCSARFGYGGWWFGQGVSINANGAYSTASSPHHNPAYFSALINNRFHPMKTSVLMFKCG